MAERPLNERFIDLEDSKYLHSILKSLKGAGIIVDSVETGEGRIPGTGVSVHMVLYIKRASGRTEVYDILVNTPQVLSIDFL